MIVDTDYTKPSGQMGGVPMFSRFGKATNAESLVFTNHEEGENAVQSTFAKDRQITVKEESDSGSDDAANLDIEQYAQRQKEMQGLE